MKREDKVRVGIFGAGIKGRSINYAFKIDNFCEYEVVCFVDDNLHGSLIEGVEVLSFNYFLDNFKDLGVSVLIWAINAHSEIGMFRKREVLEMSKRCGLELRTVLLPNEVLNKVGRVELDDLYDYILQRDSRRSQFGIGLDELKDASILVTGAAGSIGSEICRQLVRLKVRKLVIFDNAETELNALVNEISENPEAKIDIVLGDVRDVELIDKVFSENRPNYVFHAAAFKHVPMMELFPFNAVDVNFFGTSVVANASIKFGVKNFIQVSTDKSVNPTSVMGATKRLAEILVHFLSKRSDTMFTVTRFGNVIGSRGSVIPIFYDQLRRGRPLQVTHYDIERYFMTIPEAVELLLQASVERTNRGTEIYVFDMGKPLKIYEVAKRMIDYFGLQLGKNASIEIVGLREGEKLYEELFSAEEVNHCEKNTKLLKANFSGIKLSTEHLIYDFLKSYRNYRFSNKLLRLKIKEIIPEFVNNEAK